MTLTVVWHDVVLIANPVTWFTITIQYFIIHSDYQKMYSPPGRIRNSFPPLTIFRPNFIPPFIKSAFFLFPPQNSLPPPHTQKK